MAISRVAANFASTSGTTVSSLNLAWPQTPARNNLLVAAVTNDLNVDPAYLAAGWTQIGTTKTAALYTTAWFVKVVGAAEPSSVTISWTGLAGQAALALAEYAGCAVVNVHDSAVYASAQAVLNSAPAVTGAAPSTSADSLFVCLIAHSSISTLTALQDGFTSQLRQTTATVTLELLDDIETVVRTPAPAGTLGALDSWATQVVCFKQMPAHVLLPNPQLIR